MNFLEACKAAGTCDRVKIPGMNWYIAWHKGTLHQTNGREFFRPWHIKPNDLTRTDYYIEPETYDAAEAVRKLLAGERVQEEGGCIYWLDGQRLRASIPEGEDEDAINSTLLLNDALQVRWHDPEPKP